MFNCPCRICNVTLLRMRYYILCLIVLTIFIKTLSKRNDNIVRILVVLTAFYCKLNTSNDIYICGYAI